MGETPNEESFNTSKIMFYAQPGDTIDVRTKLNQPDSIRFSGNHALENNFLNRLFHVDNWPLQIRINGPIKNTLQVIRSDRKLFNSHKSRMDHKFVERLDFELTYREKEFELMELLVVPANRLNVDLRIPLKHFKQFLGQTKYPESAAYRSFLILFVKTSQLKAGLFDNSNPQSDFLAASVFLKGWDRYWVLAKLALDDLKSRTI